ncbi:MAG: HEAT repeat domain-containing protein [Verrucomicrobiota bacterium]
MGPDGCLYVVDWYNKIISHNEVARNHPDRDKQSGRIWRIRPKGFTPAAVPDYTKLTSAELIARLGSKIAADSHLAWQTLADRRDEGEALEAALSAIVSDAAAPAARRIQALWVLGEHGRKIAPLAQRLLSDANRNVRREAVNGIRHVGAWEPHLGDLVALADDPDAEVRAAAIKALGEASAKSSAALGALMSFARPSLDAPMAPDRRGQPAKAGVAYEREFERFLVVADDLVVPVDHVEAAVGAHRHGDRTEERVLAAHQVLELLEPVAGTRAMLTHRIHLGRDRIGDVHHPVEARGPDAGIGERESAQARAAHLEIRRLHRERRLVGLRQTVGAARIPGVLMERDHRIAEVIGLLDEDLALARHGEPPDVAGTGAGRLEEAAVGTEARHARVGEVRDVALGRDHLAAVEGALREPEPSPGRARELVREKVAVLDAESGQQHLP